MSENVRVLLIEDNPDDRDLVLADLEDAFNQVDVELATTLSGGLEKLNTDTFDVILSDLGLPDCRGVDTIYRLSKPHSGVPILALTASQDESIVQEVLDAGAQDYLVKGDYDIQLLRRSIDYAIRRQRVLVELEVARAQAEKAVELKEQFLACISHEIRTPLNGILGFAELLLSDETDEEKREHLGIIIESGNNLSRLIGDILQLSTLRLKGIVLDRERFDLHCWLESHLQPIALKAERKGLEFLLHIDSDVPRDILTDRLRLGQVLYNLLDNAVKFTNRGLISVQVHRSKQNLGNSEAVEFHVSDSGIGIPEGDQANIYEAFMQVQRTQGPISSGVGLGLSIIKELVSLLGGSLEMRSKETRGTTFTVTIPTNLEEKEQLGAERGPVYDRSPEVKGVLPGEERPLRVLVVDDVASNRLLARTLLKKRGHSFAEASDGKAALELAQKEPFDMVLMDVQMPIMDGLEATKELRKLLKDKQPYVVGFTAHALQSYYDLCMEAGMDTVLIKPIKVADFDRVLAHVAHSASH